MDTPAGTQCHSDDPQLPKDPVLTPHTDQLTLNADLLDTEGPLLQLTSQIPPAAASQSPNLKPLSLSPSLSHGAGSGCWSGYNGG